MKKTVHLSPGTFSQWSPYFCRVASKLQNKFPPSVVVPSEHDIEVCLEEGQLHVPPQYFAHTLQKLVATQTTVTKIGTSVEVLLHDDGFLPDECQVLFEERSYRLGRVNDPAEHEYGWYLV